MVKPTLLVLAAGMGSRYGSLKQMDGVGPNGEAIIDYSVYDAIRAGFGKVVFVIRHSFETDFKEVFNAERFGHKIEVEYVFQELDYLPEGFTLPEGRVKPWGTNHAVMMAAKAINEPFAVSMPTTSMAAQHTQPSATTSRAWRVARAATAWWAIRCRRPYRRMAPCRAVYVPWMRRATSLAWSSAHRLSAWMAQSYSTMAVLTSHLRRIHPCR